jgi:hypothetical protein
MFRAVIAMVMLTRFNPGQEFPLGRPIVVQLIDDAHPEGLPAPFEERGKHCLAPLCRAEVSAHYLTVKVISTSPAQRCRDSVDVKLSVSE